MADAGGARPQRRGRGPGHGQSSAPPGPYTLEQLADDVHGLFAALGIARTHWVGLSMGGMIGETFALKYPGVFQSLVLADTTSRRTPASIFSRSALLSPLPSMIPPAPR